MPVTPNQRAVVQAAVTARTQPIMNKEQSTLTLRTPAGRAIVERSAVQTAAGKLWSQQTAVAWKPTTLPALDYRRAREKVDATGLQRYLEAPNGRNKKI